MKTFVVTHCVWNSYGSMLQTLGLKKALLKLGCKSSLLYEMRQPEFKLKLPRTIKQAVYFPKNLFNKKRFLAQREKGLSFISDNIDIIYFDDYGELCKNNPEADLYIAGSDQIWIPNLERPMFFLDFVDGSKKRKASYAASIGVKSIPDDKTEKFKERLKDFSFISVREQQAKKCISPLTDKEVGVHVDPTFLMTAEEWRSYETPYPVKQPYILLYSIYWNKANNEKLRELSRQTGLPVYAVKPAPSRSYCTKALYDVGPQEFLWLIDNAEYVVTSSFHGAAFSAIFNKRVSLVINPATPSRLEELSNRFGVPITEIDKLSSAPETNYNTVNKRIEAGRTEAFEYLKTVIK